MTFAEIKDILTHIDWQQFHFLRPKALWLFLPLGLITLLLIAGNKERNKWKTLIAPVLRPFMFTKGSKLAFMLPLLAFIVVTTLIITAIAGPTWKKKDIPGQKIQAVVLVALDLSKSMLAKDIQPSRLERAKFKISDFFDANPRARAGLLAYAGSTHMVMPFTSDYKLIKHHAASLVNRIMPVQGSNMEVLMQVIDTTMGKVMAPSTVLIITDAIEADEAVLISNFTNHSIHKVEILLVSTPNGAAVPGYPQVISKQDASVWHNLAQDPKIKISPITLDKSDVEGIAKRVSDHLVFEKDKKQDDKDWDDMGWLLIFPSMFIALIWFRKGWVVQWCWIPLMFYLQSCSVDSKQADWWYSKDYQGQKLYNDKRYTDAADRFSDDQHKAIAYYKEGNFEAAADLFSLDTSSTGNYNRGLALAKLGRYDEAISAFDKATNLDPALKDQISHNIHSLQKVKLEMDSINRFGKNQDKKLAALDKKIKKKDPLQEHKPQTDDEKLSSDTRVKKLPNFGNRTTDEAETGIRKAKESNSPPDNSKTDKNDKLASNILLRKAVADPSEFLHKRFELQKKRYLKNIPASKHPW